MVFMERARSLDLRRACQILEVLGPVHLLGSLYANAQTQRELDTVTVDVSIYLGAVIVLLLLGPWRGRRRFLVGGLVGIALGSHLLIDLNLVSRAPFLIGLGIAGLVLAMATYAYLLIRPRAGRQPVQTR